MDNQPIEILMIEDNPGDARLIREMLSEVKDFSFHLNQADRLSAGLAGLAAGKIDVILLDLVLPDSQGLDTFDAVYRQAPRVPIIVLTILADEMTGLKAVEKGAQDYLFKGQVDGHLLVRSIRYAINRCQAEEAIQVSHRFLELTNRQTEMPSLLGACLAEIKRFTGCKAAGIQILDEEGRISYQVSEGLNQGIHESENPAMVLIPIRLGERILGLIQVANSHEHMMPPRIVNILECVSLQLGTAIQRVHTEEALRESEAKYSTLVEQAQDGVGIIQEETFVFANSASTGLTGYTIEELKGKHFLDLVIPECRKQALRLYRSYLAGKIIPPLFETKIRCQNGMIKDVEVSPTPIQYHGKKALIIISRDITERKHVEAELEKYRSHLEELVKERTAELMKVNEQLRGEIEERKRAEKLLRESEEKYSTLVEQAKDGVIIVQDGRCVFINRAMSEITGYSTEEMNDTSLSSIIISGSWSSDAQEDQPCCLLREKENKACETKIRCRDGTIKEVESSTTIIQYRGKAAVLGFVRDVTERNKLEEELQKAQKLESLGILAGGIAHDFNNILVAILGSLSLLKVYAPSEGKFSDYLARAEQATFRARDLTQQLLTFSKGGGPIKKTASIVDLLKDTAGFTLRGSKVGCEFSLPDNLWAAEIDEGQISQIISNLIINAIQAMPQGGLIKIGAENAVVRKNAGLPLKKGKYVKVSVKDEGVGIPGEDLQKIFDPYFTTKSTGTGLGLTISYSIIKKHGGYITVESEPGAGTTFFIYLPASEKEVFPGKDIEGERSMAGQGKILFMDDQPCVREIAEEILLSLGYEVELASDGHEAIELYKQARESARPFDAVILDLTVPGGLGGQETIRRLREIDPEVKAIVSSGYSNDSIMSEFEENGFRGVVAKPYEVKQLGEVVHRVVTGDKELSGGPATKVP